MTIESRQIKSVAAATAGNGATHPVRFDAVGSAGSLMDSDHQGRYRWAAQLVSGGTVLDAGCGTGYGSEILAEAGAGKVTGLDVDEGVVAEARARYGREDVEFQQGDLCALELPDDSFDLAVCFEAVEHLVDPARGIAELRRVLKPGGSLVVSSPNPAVYPGGNPHHLHELTPTELLELVEGHFPYAALHLQHAWLASLIEAGSPEAESEGKVWFRRVGRRAPEEATFGVVIGSDREVEPMADLVSLGDPFEVRWWEEQVSFATASSAHDAPGGQDEGAPTAGLAARLREAEARLESQARESARALAAAEESERQARLRLKDTGAALLEANQELAEAPLLKHRLAELYRENAELEAFRDTMLDSRSWRWTRHLRNLSAFLKLTR